MRVTGFRFCTDVGPFFGSDRSGRDLGATPEGVVRRIGLAGAFLAGLATSDWANARFSRRDNGAAGASDRPSNIEDDFLGGRTGRRPPVVRFATRFTGAAGASDRPDGMAEGRLGLTGRAPAGARASLAPGPDVATALLPLGFLPPVFFPPGFFPLAFFAATRGISYG